MNIKAFIQHYPVVSYFAMVFAISWLGAFIVVAPELLHGAAIPRIAGLLMYPIMMLGPSLSGIILTAIVAGRSGLRDLFSRMGRWRVGARWYTALLIPPILIPAVLVTLSLLLSPVFFPHLNPFSIVFGLVSGFLEEIGWTGFAFPRMQARRSALLASLLLGLLWGVWHFPVIDFLGAASPHGAYLPLFVLAFIVVVWAIRVLIAWLYTNTKSVLLAQLLHSISTGCLVMFSPLGVSPAQEALWYAVYAAVLWLVVALVVARYGKGLRISSNNLVRFC